METWKADFQKLATTWTFRELIAHASHPAINSYRTKPALMHHYHYPISI